MPAAVRVPAAIPDPKVLTRREVCRRISVGPSKLYGLIRAGRFPKPIKIVGSSRWVTAEVDRWLADQIAASER